MYDPDATTSSAAAPLFDINMEDLDCFMEEERDETDAAGQKTSDVMFKERRREAHTMAEQKRRDSIKRGYDMLQQVVPTCKPIEGSNHKISKAAVLQKSIEYIEFLQSHRRKQETERNTLRKDLRALQIMQANYEQIVSSQQSSSGQSDPNAGEKEKFAIFQGIMDIMFETFEPLPVSNFAEFSAGVFGWLEEYCQPQYLGAVVQHVLEKQSLSN